MTTVQQDRIKQAQNALRQLGQEQLWQFWEQLNDSQRAQLLADIESLDLDTLDTLIEQYVLQEPKYELPDEILPPPVYPLQPTEDLREKYQQARQFTANAIRQDQVAAFVVAGGMGTRLGFDGPKGCYPATPIRKKVLFQVFADKILAAQNRYGGVIPFYVMTSSANHDATEQAFAENNYFGLDSDNVFLFQQGLMPCFDCQGKILRDEKHRLAMSPDGHGGSLLALYKSGALEDMKKRGVEYISYWQVDNPQLHIIDPLFIGLHALDQAEMSSKALIKCEPLEKVGNFVLVHDRITVIEYSDLPDELAFQKRTDGKLVFELGSPAIHVLSRSFVERINQHGFSLPWHRADKKISYIDEKGMLIDPDEPNGVKLETFIFDALPLAAKSIILTIDRVEEFAPIKNATGVDSAESSRTLQIERAARWLESAGVAVPRHTDGTVDATIEISPHFALDAQELKAKAAKVPTILAGTKNHLE